MNLNQVRGAYITVVVDWAGTLVTGEVAELEAALEVEV